MKNNCEAVTGHRGIGLMQGLQFAETMPVGTIVNKALLEEKFSFDQRSRRIQSGLFRPVNRRKRRN